MKRATAVRERGTFAAAEEVGRVELTYDGRHRRRMAMRGEDGLSFLLDLPEAMALRAGDGLVLEDGGVVRVVASAEPVAEITGDVHLLMRVAWHIGNRHVPAEILPDRIRIGRDHVLEAMVAGLGASVERVEAPFQPEPGAYAGGGGHSHGAHSQAHSHGTHDHDHGRDVADGAEMDERLAAEDALERRLRYRPFGSHALDGHSHGPHSHPHDHVHDHAPPTRAARDRGSHAPEPSEAVRLRR